MTAADAMQTLAPSYTGGEAETAVALMESIYGHKGFDAFYTPHCDEFEGRVGLYHYVLTLAQQLEWTVSVNGGWDELDWYLTCDKLADLIISSDSVPNPDDALCVKALTT